MVRKVFENVDSSLLFSCFSCDGLEAILFSLKLSFLRWNCRNTRKLNDNWSVFNKLVEYKLEEILFIWFKGKLKTIWEDEEFRTLPPKHPHTWGFPLCIEGAFALQVKDWQNLFYNQIRVCYQCLLFLKSDITWPLQYKGNFFVLCWIHSQVWIFDDITQNVVLYRLWMVSRTYYAFLQHYIKFKNRERIKATVEKWLLFE